MQDSKRDGNRFVDPEDLAAAERMIREGHDAEPRKNRGTYQPKPQFTLASIMVFMFFVCLGFAARGEWFPAPLFAGIMGFVAIGTIIWTTVARPSHSRGRVVWIGIALAYFIACVVALFKWPGE